MQLTNKKQCAKTLKKEKKKKDPNNELGVWGKKINMPIYFRIVTKIS